MLSPLARRTLLAGASKRLTVAPTLARSFAATPASRSDDHHHGPPIIQGSGAKPGTVPTDLEQSTGIERFEILSRMQGEDPFSNKPLEVKHMGTLKNPIKVWSLEPERLVGCTGYPVDSHDPLWMKVTMDLPRRCQECGCAYQIDYAGSEDTLHHRPAPTMLHGVEGETPRLKWGWADSPTSRGTNQR